MLGAGNVHVCCTLVMLLLLEATAKEKNEGGGKNGWKLPSRQCPFVFT
jgi:hypothetical protein